jgi:hypothetical protein
LKVHTPDVAQGQVSLSIRTTPSRDSGSFAGINHDRLAVA